MSLFKDYIQGESKQVNLNNKNYLLVSVANKFGRKIIDKETTITDTQLYFEEPNFSDWSKLEELSIMLNDFHRVYIRNIKLEKLIADSVSYHEEVSEQKAEVKPEEAKAKQATEDQRRVITGYTFLELFESNANNENFHRTINALFDFIADKVHSNCQGLSRVPLAPQSIAGITHLDWFFFKQAIIIEYLSFFFIQFPCTWFTIFQKM